MTALDWVLLLIIGVSALMGAWRGLIGVAASLAAWFFAGVAAYYFGGDTGALLAAQGAPSWGESVSGYVLAFLVVWIAVTLLGWILRRLAQSAGLSPLDRTLGLGLGAARGLFLACALLLGLALTAIPREPTWRASLGVQALLPMAGWLRTGVPDWMAQRMDLEGRGGSLQAQLHDQAQALQDTLPPGVTLEDVAGQIAATQAAGTASELPPPVPENGADAHINSTRSNSTRSNPGRTGSTPDAAAVQ